MFSIPPIVRRKAEAEGVSWWLDEIPGMVHALREDWSLTIDSLLSGGTESMVFDAETFDGDALVLKLILPRDEAAVANEITALRLAGGDGCALLLRFDESKGALLLERLGRSLYELDFPVEKRHEVLADTLKHVWRPAPHCGLPTGADKGQWLLGFITTTWEELDRPCSERAVTLAVEAAQRRIAAHDDERSVLVHGDAHSHNALQFGDGFKLVDPDGLLAEAEYDLGVVMREDLDTAEFLNRSGRLADLTGLDEQSIQDWATVERMSTGLLCTKVDLQPFGWQMLQAADRLASEVD